MPKRKTPDMNRLGHPIAGVGASAGGLEAFTGFLRALPTDTGMSYVLVQHLAPGHESILPELLAKATTMPVTQAHDRTRVEPDHIYVIPPGVDIAIFHGTLQLVGREKTKVQRMPVDYFLRSLAQDQGAGAMGVVLSGTGSDGALGVRAIKAEDGVTFAQDPATAMYDGMPRAAIATAAVDLVLPLDEIASEMARIARHPYVKRRKPAQVVAKKPQMKDALLTKLFIILREVTGVDFSVYKSATVERRIARRMLIYKMEKLEAYVDYLTENREEVNDLYQDLLINVTNFFREAEAFEALQQKVFPLITKGRAGTQAIRIWVPGCSTGEEAYSIAIALVEFLDTRAVKPPIMIFASDIDEDALERARAGIYPESVKADLSPERLERFFVHVDGGYQVSKSIREICIFSRHDLTRDPPFSRMDVVSCRNVLIYLGSAAQKRIIPVLHHALARDGFLMLGLSENIGEFDNLFSLFDRKQKIYRKKAVKAALPLKLEFGARGPAKPEVPLLGLAPGMVQRPKRADLRTQADQVLLDRYAPAGVLLDKDFQIVQFRGDTSPYLYHPSGRATLNLFDMIHADLAAELRIGINEARKTGAPVVRERAGIAFPATEKHRPAVIEMIPITAADGDRYFWVLFKEVEPAPEVEEPRPGKARAKGRKGEEAEELRQELAKTKNELWSTIQVNETANEELTAAFEELQSSNEELQSINEELETSKEELESTNEELATVNQELENRNRELIEVTDDLENLLASTTIPIVLLGRNLEIRRFTEAAGSVLNIISSDIGRPISDLALNIEVHEIEQLSRGVMESLRPVERELRDRQGRWYSLQIRPYVTSRHMVSGVLLAFIDINLVKQNQLEAEEARLFAQSLVDTVREPLIVLDADMYVLSANRSFYRVFRVSEKETEKYSFFELGNHQWDIPPLRELLEKLIPERNVLKDYEVEHEFPEIGQKTMLLNARRVLREGRGPTILVAIEDITERKRAESELGRIMAELERSNADLQHFAQIAAHDLKEPLRNITQFIKILDERYSEQLDEKARELMALVRDGADRMQELIMGLLNYSQAESRGKPFEPSDLTETLKRALEDLRSEVEESGAMVTNDPLPKVNVDPLQIAQVFKNLISNAIKFRSEEPLRIHVSVSRKDGFWQLSVSDNGIGIDSRHLRRIFEIFRRLEARDKYPGVGIGLAICKRIMERHGGEIWAESEPGKGSTFYFTIPVAAEKKGKAGLGKAAN